MKALRHFDKIYLIVNLVYYKKKLITAGNINMVFLIDLSARYMVYLIG